MKTRVIAVSLTKGGTGKTTTAINVASALARLGRETLLIDLDTQGQAGSALTGEKIPHGIAEYLTNKCEFDQALYTEKLVSAASLEKAFTGAEFESGAESVYGFGWFLKEDEGKKTVYHGGSWAGFKNTFVREIDEGNTYIFFSNFVDSPNNRVRSEFPKMLRESMR